MDAKPRRRRGSGSLGQLKARFWAVIAYTSGLVEDDGADHALRLKASTAFVQGALAYARLLEQSELEARVTRLEERRTRGRRPMTDIRRRVAVLETRASPPSELAQDWYAWLRVLRDVRVRAEARRGTDCSPPSDTELFEEAKSMAATGRTFSEELRQAFLDRQARRAATHHGRGEEGWRGLIWMAFRGRNRAVGPQD